MGHTNHSTGITVESDFQLNLIYYKREGPGQNGLIIYSCGSLFTVNQTSCIYGYIR
jgi:hypothetical protein